MFRSLYVPALLLLLACLSLGASKSPSTARNHELLSRLGLHKVRGPTSHHRKRLAVESRHHSRSDDSHMFVVKLPPLPHYYALSEPARGHSRSLPVGFRSNGRPGKVYHWNLPVLNRMVAEQRAKAKDPNRWNEVLDKPEEDRKPQKPSYYVPTKPKKAGLTKYFPGNGKPHSFYVIERSKKAHYHRLLP